MQKYYVIGNPVNHSLSPIIHSELYRQYNIDALYERKDISPGHLQAFLNALPDEVNGFNVTMPLKEPVMRYMDCIDTTVNGSVNTVAIKDGLRTGYSTDFSGFLTSLQINSIDFKNKNIVVLGNGAVAKSFLAETEFQAAGSIAVLSRRPLDVGIFNQHGNIRCGKLAEINSFMAKCDLLINTTPLGMQGVSADFRDLSFLSSLPQGACVYDLIYRPSKTTLLRTAEQLGYKTINGLPMLIWQAFYSFRIWFGIMPGMQDYHMILKKLRPTLG